MSASCLVFAKWFGSAFDCTRHGHLRGNYDVEPVYSSGRAKVYWNHKLFASVSAYHRFAAKLICQPLKNVRAPIYSYRIDTIICVCMYTRLRVSKGLWQVDAGYQGVCKKTITLPICQDIFIKIILFKTTNL